MADMKGNVVETNVQNEEFTQENDIVEVVVASPENAWVKAEVQDAQEMDKPVVEIEEVDGANTFPMEEARGPQPPSGILQFFAYFVAIILLSNFLGLSADLPLLSIALLTAKTVTGAIGLGVLCRSKTNFVLVKAYAVVVALVYFATLAARTYVTYAYREEITHKICSNMEGNFHVTQDQCAHRVWFSLRVHLFVFAVYAGVAFIVTLSYAIHSDRYHRELRQFEKESEFPPV